MALLACATFLILHSKPLQQWLTWSHLEHFLEEVLTLGVGCGVSVYLLSLDGAVFHVEIPDFDRQIVSGHDIPPTVAEFHI